MFEGALIFYRATYLIGFILMMVINLKTHKRYKLTTASTIVITLVTYVAGIAGALIMGKVYGMVMAHNGFNAESNVAIMGAVIFTPLFMIIVSLFLKQKWYKVTDMLAPGIFLILACAKFGCFIYGCCHGIECSWGIKYPNNDMTVLPIQIIEVAIMSLIIAFCFWYSHKSKRYIPGTAYPVTTILYCTVRFFVEFFRYYEFEGQRHVVFGMTLWQFCCTLCIIISIVWIIALKNIDKKSNQEAA